MRISRRSLILTTSMLPLVGAASANAQRVTYAESTPVSEISSFNALFQFVPDGLVEDEFELSWIDFDKQRESAPSPELEELAGMTGLYVGGPTFMSRTMLMEDFAGYPLDAVRSVVAFALPPDSGHILRVSIDPNELLEAWKSFGYEERESEYGQFWTIGEEPSVDISHPVQQSVMAAFNNVAILSDDTIAYASSAVLLDQIRATGQGDESNSADSLAVLGSGMPEQSVNALIISGNVLDVRLSAVSLQPNAIEQALESLEQSDEEVGPMPQIRALNTGVTAGASFNRDVHDPNSEEFLLLELSGSDDVTKAIDVINWRHENLASDINGAPYADLAPDLTVAEAGENVVMLSRVLSEPNTVFANMIRNRDIKLFGY